MLTRRDIDAYSTPRPDFFSVPKLPHCAKFASSVARHACGVPSRGRLRNADRISHRHPRPRHRPDEGVAGFSFARTTPWEKIASSCVDRPPAATNGVDLTDGLYFAGGK
jgi:hypothetical protein